MRTVRVLVVDDQDPFRRAMAAVVAETDGFEVVGEASSGEESVESAAALLPDLVLMDVHLPGIDGVEATRRLLAAAAPPVVLLLSTYDEDAGDQFLARSGAAGYLTKSAFGPDRLEAAWASARPASS
jgi:DNA-binding NarL/FixJ family response regulator